MAALTTNKPIVVRMLLMRDMGKASFPCYQEDNIYLNKEKEIEIRDFNWTAFLLDRPVAWTTMSIAFLLSNFSEFSFHFFKLFFCFFVTLRSGLAIPFFRFL